MKNTDMPSAWQLPFRFDSDRLLDDLERISLEAWQPHFNQAIYQGDWSGVALRAVPGSHLAIYSDPTAEGCWADTSLLNCCDYFREVLGHFACPLLSVRLLRLAPGAIIKEHLDYALGLAYGEVRIHVVVTTNPGVGCCIDGQNYQWAVGECWYADFGKLHSFANNGKTDRVHLVLDCKVDNWLLNLLNSSLAEA